MDPAGGGEVQVPVRVNLLREANREVGAFRLLYLQQGDSATFTPKSYTQLPVVSCHISCAVSTSCLRIGSIT